jgi:hypothetical protein
LSVDTAVAATVRRLTVQAIGKQAEAAAFFRPRFDLPPAPQYGAVIPLVLWLGRSAVHVVRHAPSVRRLPRPAYIAVTASEVYVLEFRFGTTVKLNRIAETWHRSDVVAKRIPEAPFGVDLRLTTGRVARLSAVEPGAEAARVIDVLVGPSDRQS